MRLNKQVKESGKNMRLIGVTGGVGSGKSTVLAYLEEAYQAEVIKLDDVARRLEEKGGACYEGMVALCGREAVNPDDSLNRAYIAESMYRDRALREKINALVHPAVEREAVRMISRKKASGCRLLLIEAALLIEKGYDAICDELWYIYADEKIRRERLRASRHYSDEKITAILKSQLSDEIFRKYAGVVIDNSGSFEETKARIRQIMEKK